MFYYIKIPYITCTFSTKFIYNGYIGPYLYRTLFCKIFASACPPPRDWIKHLGITIVASSRIKLGDWFMLVSYWNQQ